MKKKIMFFSLAIAFGITTFQAVQAEEIPRSLPEQNDPFWEVLSQLNRPDDSTCTAKTTILLTARSIPEAATRAATLCHGIAQMVTSMQPDMEAHGISTNLFSSTDWHHLDNLYFETAFGKIQFTRQIDFMSYNFMLFFNNLTSRLEMEKDKIGLDADIVNGMRNTGTILTMKNVSSFADPEILIDGEIDEEGVVSGLTYDRANNTLVFNAAHFTTFEAIESSEVNQKAKIQQVSYTKYKNKLGKEKIKVTIKGKHFDKDAQVKLGNQKASKVKRENNRKLVAYFSLKNLPKSAYLKVKNPGTESRKYKEKMILSSIK